MKRILILSALTVAMLLGLVACGNDDEIKDLSVATSDNVEKTGTDEGESDEKNEDSIIRAKVNKAWLYTTEDHRKNPWDDYSLMFGEDAALEFKCADIMYETGKEPHHFTSNEYLAIASKVSSEEEFVEEFLKLNIVPDLVIGKQGTAEVYHLDSHFGVLSLIVNDSKDGMLISGWTVLNSSMQYPDLLDEVTLYIVKEDASTIIGDKYLAKEYVSTVCEEYEKKDFSIVEYPYSEGIKEGKVKYYPHIDIDSMLSIKEENEDLDAFLEEFNKMMPVPDAIYVTDDNKCKKELYLVEVNGLTNGVVVERKENGIEIGLLIEIKRDKYRLEDLPIGEIMPQICEYYKLTYDEITREKIDEIRSKSIYYLQIP